jgi:hypothetical protein
MLPTYLIQTRPHIGCASCPVVYEIVDRQTGAIVRSQLSNPSPEDCMSAVRSHRAARGNDSPPTPAKTTRPAGGAAAGRRGKRVNLHL